MTQEDKEFLKDNFKYIEMAGTRDYVIGVPMKIAKEFFNIAKRNNIKTGSISCHKCVYDCLKALYKIYSSEMPKEEINIINIQEEEIVSECTTEISEESETPEPIETPEPTKTKRTYNKRK